VLQVHILLAILRETLLFSALLCAALPVPLLK